MSTPLTDSMIHRAKVQYSNSATGEIQVIIPSVTSKTGVVPITMWGRESHAANSKWLVPDVGDTIVVCREDEDYTNVFWLNTTVPPDPPYTFDDSLNTQFSTLLQVDRTNGQIRVNTATAEALGGYYFDLVSQPSGLYGYGFKIMPTTNSTTNRAAMVLGSHTEMGTGGTNSVVGDWFIHDNNAVKYNLYHSGHSDTTTGGLTIRSTGLSERYIGLHPAYMSGSNEFGYLNISNVQQSLLLNGALRPLGCHPWASANYNLGSASLEWSQIYLVNNPIVSSDQNYKTDIVDSNLGLDFINDLRPVSFKLLFTDGREGVRTHYGLIAQEVESVLGADASDTAIWTKETLEASPEVPADGDLPGLPAVEEHEKQGLRYDELIAPMIKAIQELTTRLAALESA